MTTPPEPLLEITGLSVTYDRGRRREPLTAVRDVDLTLAAGQTLSVVGESGSGKSTIGNAVLGLVTPTAGSIQFAGNDITHLTAGRRRELTSQIQAVFQDPHGSFNPSRTIGQTLEEPLLAHTHADRSERRRRVEEMLDRVGLSRDAAGRYPAQLSGGQLQRAAIARALMLEPRLIICDEAVSSLDLSIQAQIINLLTELQNQLNISLLFISHDLAVVRHVSHSVAVLYRGQLMETGRADTVTRAPGHPYTQALLAAAPVPNPGEQRTRRQQRRDATNDRDPNTSLRSEHDTLSGCPFRPRCPHAGDICADPLPRYPTPHGFVACHRLPELTLASIAPHDKPAAATPPTAATPRPSTGQPSTAQPSTAQPSTARPGSHHA